MSRVCPVWRDGGFPSVKFVQGKTKHSQPSRLFSKWSYVNFYLKSIGPARSETGRYHSFPRRRKRIRPEESVKVVFSTFHRSSLCKVVVFLKIFNNRFPEIKGRVSTETKDNCCTYLWMISWSDLDSCVFTDSGSKVTGGCIYTH